MATGESAESAREKTGDRDTGAGEIGEQERARSAKWASGTGRGKASLNSLPFTTPGRRRNNRPASNQLVSIAQNDGRIAATHHQTGISRRTLVILGLKNLGKLAVRADLITIRIHDILQDQNIIKIPSSAEPGKSDQPRTTQDGSERIRENFTRTRTDVTILRAIIKYHTLADAIPHGNGSLQKYNLNVI